MLKALQVLLLIGGGVVLYVAFLRPRLAEREELKAFYANCDSFWQKAWLQFRHWWLFVVSAAAMILPELPDLLSQLSLFDLSFFLPEEKAKWWSRAIGIAAFVLRMVQGTPMPKIEEPKP